jgi:hypothetical protein
MNIYYENPQFYDNLPDELKNHICSFLPLRPFIEELKKCFILLELFQVSMCELWGINKRFKDYCSKKGVNYKKYDEKMMIKFVKEDIMFLFQLLNFNGDKFQRFKEAYIKQYGIPTMPEGWVD